LPSLFSNLASWSSFSSCSFSIYLFKSAISFSFCMNFWLISWTSFSFYLMIDSLCANLSNASVSLFSASCCFLIKMTNW
jgi:hypothetical protein